MGLLKVKVAGWRQQPFGGNLKGLKAQIQFLVCTWDKSPCPLAESAFLLWLEHHPLFVVRGWARCHAARAATPGLQGPSAAGDTGQTRAEPWGLRVAYCPGFSTKVLQPGVSSGLASQEGPGRSRGARAFELLSEDASHVLR